MRKSPRCGRWNPDTLCLSVRGSADIRVLNQQAAKEVQYAALDDFVALELRHNSGGGGGSAKS